MAAVVCMVAKELKEKRKELIFLTCVKAEEGVGDCSDLFR
jgi:hypothetical protein